MRVAVVLFNLGGPDGPEDVQPFLFNLFNDPAIIRVAGPLRWLLAKLISWRRRDTAQAIYRHMGGGSPLRENTQAQADALERALQDRGMEARCFLAMRYWHPMSLAAAEAVQAFRPDRIMLLPLYPQFSTTTTGSSGDAWGAACAQVGLAVPTRRLCCYPSAQGFVQTIADRVREALAEDGVPGRRVLFTAHGLPERIVADGDPYQWQVEQTVAAVVAAVDVPDLDWVICYQSRVGPMKWIGPATDDEIVRAGEDGVPLLVVPIAFVSEHSETLVELDIEYRELAGECRVPNYRRIETVSVAAGFIATLADLVVAGIDRDEGPWSETGGRICPKALTGCPAALG